MGFFNVFTPLVHTLSRQKIEKKLPPVTTGIDALPGEFIARIGNVDWKPTDLTILINESKVSIYTINREDSSAINIEFIARKSNDMEATHVFAQDLKTMMTTRKENALLYLPAGSHSALNFLTTVDSGTKPGYIRILTCNWIDRTLTGKFEAIVGHTEIVKITGSFNQIVF